MMFQRGPWLGQVPLVLGPSSWGAGMIPTGPAIAAVPTPVPPFYGEWAVVDESTGKYTDGGRVGPYDTIDEAFNAAAAAASDAGARKMPLDGFAQVKDSRGQAVGPVT
jgi:hypothetical protein